MAQRGGWVSFQKYWWQKRHCRIGDHLPGLALRNTNRKLRLASWWNIKSVRPRNLEAGVPADIGWHEDKAELNAVVKDVEKVSCRLKQAVDLYLLVGL